MTSRETAPSTIRRLAMSLSIARSGHRESSVERPVAGLERFAAPAPAGTSRAPALYEEAVRRGEGLDRRGGSARLPDRAAHRTIAERQVHRARARQRARHRLGRREPADGAGALRPRCSTTCSRSLEGTELFVQDCYAGADPKYRLPIRVITEYAWHSLFARNLFIVDPPATAPSTRAERSRSSTRRASRPIPRATAPDSDVVIALNFAKRLVLIGGTSYAGEIKKSIFTILNYLLPLAAACCRCTARPTSGRPATWRCSSGCRAPARRRSRAIPSGG